MLQVDIFLEEERGTRPQLVHASCPHSTYSDTVDEPTGRAEHGKRRRRRIKVARDELRLEVLWMTAHPGSDLKQGLVPG